jgi:hypothetical protein
LNSPNGNWQRINLKRINNGEENTIVFQDPSRVKTPRINPQTLTLKKHPLSPKLPLRNGLWLACLTQCRLQFSNASYGI